MSMHAKFPYLCAQSKFIPDIIIKPSQRLFQYSHLPSNRWKLLAYFRNLQLLFPDILFFLLGPILTFVECPPSIYPTIGKQWKLPVSAAWKELPFDRGGLKKRKGTKNYFYGNQNDCHKNYKHIKRKRFENCVNNGSFTAKSYKYFYQHDIVWNHISKHLLAKKLESFNTVCFVSINM